MRVMLVEQAIANIFVIGSHVISVRSHAHVVACGVSRSRFQAHMYAFMNPPVQGVLKRRSHGAVVLRAAKHNHVRRGHLSTHMQSHSVKLHG